MNISVNPAPGFRERPQHRITTEPFHGVVVATFGDAIVASTKDAIVLREGSYPPVFYIPFRDIYFDVLSASGTTSYCPFKGNASYWNVTAGGEAAKDVMWAYQAPFDEMLAIKEHGAFYPNRVRVEATAKG